MSLDIVTVIRVLTMACLTGLLLEVGLRLTLPELTAALRRSRLLLILLTNFVGVPLLVLGLVIVFRLSTEVAIGMLLLGAAPFAPVVPVFTKMARADLPLAAGLTALVPLFSAFLTPLVCVVMMRWIPGAGELQFNVLRISGLLMGTITAPLLVGVALRHWAPGLTRRLARPVEVLSEATGAVSLTVVAITEFGSVAHTPWMALVAMVVGFEVSLALGYWLGGGHNAPSRQVVALGTSNRNIALALLLAMASFAETEVVPAVVTNGLVLILLGLFHVALWRFGGGRSDPALARIK